MQFGQVNNTPLSHTPSGFRNEKLGHKTSQIYSDHTLWKVKKLKLKGTELTIKKTIKLRTNNFPTNNIVLPPHLNPCNCTSAWTGNLKIVLKINNWGKFHLAL